MKKRPGLPRKAVKLYELFRRLIKFFFLPVNRNVRFARFCSPPQLQKPKSSLGSSCSQKGSVVTFCSALRSRCLLKTLQAEF
jgi:hypothetical protein